VKPQINTDEIPESDAASCRKVFRPGKVVLHTAGRVPNFWKWCCTLQNGFQKFGSSAARCRKPSLHYDKCKGYSSLSFNTHLLNFSSKRTYSHVN